MDIATVAVFSDPDAGLPYVLEADEAVRLPGSAPAETYLRGEALIAAAAATGADAVHPGYGFLSENAGFARACAAAGLTFVGPVAGGHRGHGVQDRRQGADGGRGRPRAAGRGLRRRGRARSRASCARPRRTSASRCWSRRRTAAAAGACGSCASADEIADAVASARREAASAFGNGTVFLERFVESPRHIEVQILGDQAGTVVHLFERECSIQRRYQKIIEEAPSPAVGDALRAELCQAAVAAGQAIGYVGAGTVEFVLDASGRFYFLEVNTRLQVEHPVTELITGLDLVRLQLEIAAGQPPIPAEVTEARIHRPRHRGPALRRGRAGRVPARERRRAHVRDRRRRRAARRRGLRLRHPGQHVLRLDAGQGDRVRPDPRRRPAGAGRGAVPGPAARRRDQPRPAGRHPARAGVRGGPDRHRLPGPAPARGAVPARSRRPGPCTCSRWPWPGRPGGAPRPRCWARCPRAGGTTRAPRSGRATSWTGGPPR